MVNMTLEATQAKQEEFLRAYQKVGCVVDTAAGECGITRMCVWKWQQKYPALAVTMAEMKQAMLADRLEEIEELIYQWAKNPEKKVGMVNFLAAMAWLKAHEPAKWNEKSFKYVEKKVTITRIEVEKDYGPDKKKEIETRDIVEAETRELPASEEIDPVV